MLNKPGKPPYSKNSSSEIETSFHSSKQRGNILNIFLLPAKLSLRCL